ncbi:MAG: hypothetical protein ACXADX_13285 [Candidatus Hodarchaeales archaeon]|jgi:hypothetical protein
MQRTLDNLELSALKLANSALFLTSDELIDNSKVSKIESQVRELGNEIVPKASYKKATAIGKRVRHQMFVYQVLKYCKEMKNSGFKYIIVKGKDDFAQRGKTVKVFKINLLNGNEGQMLSEIQTMLDHISGWNTWGNIKSWPSRNLATRVNRFEKYELAFGYYLASPRSHFIRLSQRSLNIWRKRQRHMMATLWENLTGAKISESQLSLLYHEDEWGRFIPDLSAKGRYGTTSKKGNIPPGSKPLPLKQLEDLVECFTYKHKKSFATLPDALKSSEKEALTRGTVLEFYADMVDPTKEPQIIFEVSINTNLFDSLFKTNANSDFFMKKGKMTITLIDDTGKKAAEDLTKIALHDLKNVERIQFNALLLKKLLIDRIEELSKSNLRSKKGTKILDMLAGRNNQLLKGLDHEEMLSELGELLTQAASIELISILNKNISPAAAEYLGLMKGLREGEWKICPSKSLSPGTGAATRSTAARRPIDHILHIEHIDQKEPPYCLFISDKRTRFRTDGGSTYISVPDNGKLKQDINNLKWWAEGDSDELIADLRQIEEDGVIVGWKSEYYQDGLDTGIGNSIERVNFDRIYESFTTLAEVRRILILRNMMLTKDADSGDYIFSMSLQIGKSAKGTLLDSLKALREASERYSDIADGILQEIELAMNIGKTDADKIFSQVFWIKNPKGGLLPVERIQRNFQKGLMNNNVQLQK